MPALHVYTFLRPRTTSTCIGDMGGGGGGGEGCSPSSGLADQSMNNKVAKGLLLEGVREREMHAAMPSSSTFLMNLHKGKLWLAGRQSREC